jgi:hypothetical protein
MCANSVSKALGEPQGRDRAAFPGPSVSGVDLRIAWDGRTVLRKVRLTQLVRDGGMRLRDAARVTGRVVDGEVVDVHLPRFGSAADVAEALRAIGVTVANATGIDGRTLVTTESSDHRRITTSERHHR